MSIYGAISGDVIGSPYEIDPIKTTDFSLFSPLSHFTDDTVLTVAIAHSLLRDKDYGKFLEDYYYKFPNLVYGARFIDWASSHEHQPYNSWGNGSAMRVSPVAHYFETLDEVLHEAEKCAAVTHNHPEGIRGAKAVALSIFLSRTGSEKFEIKEKVEEAFGYDLSRSIEEIRPEYKCDLSCQGTVPEAITCFLESNCFEDSIRKAVSLGGDSDTMACITGSISSSFYGIPQLIKQETIKRLDPSLIEIIEEFEREIVEQKSSPNH